MLTEWCTLAPVSFFGFPPYIPPPLNLEKPFDLGCGVMLGLIQYWAKEGNIQQDLSLHQRGRINQGTYALSVEYQADSLGDRDLEWKGERPRSKQERALEGITLANLALWIAQPSGLGLDFMIHAEKRGREWSLRQSSVLSELIPHGQDQNAWLNLSDLRLARELTEALTALPRD